LLSTRIVTINLLPQPKISKISAGYALFMGLEWPSILIFVGSLGVTSG